MGIASTRPAPRKKVTCSLGASSGWRAEPSISFAAEQAYTDSGAQTTQTHHDGGSNKISSMFSPRVS